MMLLHAAVTSQPILYKTKLDLACSGLSGLTHPLPMPREEIEPTNPLIQLLVFYPSPFFNFSGDVKH
jgi:hypothetical protein